MENPKIRFRMDNGLDYPHWGSKSFEEVFSPLNNNTFSRDMLNYEEGTAKSIHYGDILTTYGAICDVSSDVIPFVNEGIAYEKYDYLQNGDVILADTAEDETVGKAIELQGIKCETVISGLHTMACRPKQKYAPKYLGYLLNSPAFHNQLFPYMQGIKVTSIGRKNIASVKISYPCPAEQEKIADFLSSVDEVIIQSEKEVQNLEQQKKAAMQKVFSQEIRLKKANGTAFPEWKEKSLNDLSILITKGTTPKGYSESGNVNFVQINSIIDGRVVANKCLKIDEDTHNGFLARSVLHENDILCSIAGALGVIAIVEKSVLPANTNQALSIIRLNKECNYKYIAYALSSYIMEKYIKQSKTTGAQPNLSLQQMRDFIVPVPHIEEQQKIADFLSAFDEAIDYAKQELEKWKELKKGLLQQMFV